MPSCTEQDVSLIGSRGELHLVEASGASEVNVIVVPPTKCLVVNMVVTNL